MKGDCRSYHLMGLEVMLKQQFDSADRVNDTALYFRATLKS